MKLFTIGPAQMHRRTLEVAGRQVPYFRNQEFSEVVLDCERLLKRFAHAPDDARMILLTASGTGAMEATVMNCFDVRDRLLVVDGGSFGHRFTRLCEIHGIGYDSIVLAPDEELSASHLESYAGTDCTGLLVNLDETSTGQLYDLDMLARFAHDNGMLLVVDAISAFLSDPIDMAQAGIDALIVSSQKALAIAPGISVVLLSGRMMERLGGVDCRSMYFDFKDYLENGLRGQTPFTPAVGIVYELQDRLHAIEEAGGVEAEVERIATLAHDFRERVAGLPLSIASFRKSNAVTRIVFNEPIAKTINQRLIDDYGFVLNPCGGELADYALRVAHVGDLTLEDNEMLVRAIVDLLAEI